MFYKDYDNYYDVINSLYGMLTFLRSQLSNFDRFHQIDNDCYKQIEGMIKTIGEVLTKYQSDYRRYYESKIKGNGSSFISFKSIQAEYDQITEMTDDFQKLNTKMEPYVKYFSIDVNKWAN